MEKKKTQKKNRSTVTRIQNSDMNYIKKIGDGDIKLGLNRIFSQHKSFMRDPKEIIKKDIVQLGEDAKQFLPENHYEHYVGCNLPALLMNWADTGRVDTRFLKSPNKDLDSYSKKEDEDK